MASRSVWRPAGRVGSPLLAAMAFAFGCGGDGGGGSPTTPAPPPPTPPPAADPAANLCERTPQVRDAILARLSATDCGAVTVAQLGALNEGLELESQGITSLQSGDFAGLGGLAWLNLRNNSLTALSVDLFDGLGRLCCLILRSNRLSALPSGVFSSLPLRVLDLAENQLSSLPSGLFAGLPLLNLYLDGNPGAPFSLPLTLEAVDPSGTTATTAFRVEFAHGAPFPMTVRLSATGAALSPSQVAIPLGGTQSEEFTVTPQGAAWSVVARADPPENEPGYGGFFIAAASFEPPTYVAICGRTPQVRDAILSALALTDCSAVVDTQLASVSVLDLAGQGITSLNVDDFAGLTGLERLNLSGNALTTLPESVFTGLGNLRRLFLQDNPGSPFHFSLAFEEVSSSGTTMVLRVTIAPGVPFGITVALSATNARLSSSVVTIPAGGRMSRQFSVLPSAASWSLTAAGPDLPSSSYAGFTITDATFAPETASSTDGGICGRTPEVRDGILALLPVNDCAAVTTAQLEELPGLLNLRNRGIASLKSGDFAGLTALSRLDLEHNRLNSLPADVFDEMGSLEVLRLADNSLRSLPSRVFDNLDGLSELGLSSNPLERLPARTFRSLGGLRTLGLSRISLRSAPRDVLERLDLEQLDLSGNLLSSLPTDLFAGQGRLEELNLSGNLFSELPSGVFDGLGDLEILYLEGNSLATLPAGLFGDLASLRGLNLHQNSLSGLPAGVFDGLVNLDALVLYENSLSTLPAGVFEGLNNLGFLRLDGNSLTTLPAGIFDGLVNLDALVLYENSLRELPAGVFDGLANLQNLNLYRNSLTELPAGVFGRLGNLGRLVLSQNSLTTVPAGVFEGLSNLAILFLSENALERLPERVFEGLTSLELLHLEDNPGAPFNLPLKVEEVSRAGTTTTLRVEFEHGAPFPMTIALRADGATLSSPSVTIPTGGIQSDEFTVTGTTASWSVTAVGPPLPSTGFGGQYRGFVIVDAVFPPEE